MRMSLLPGSGGVSTIIASMADGWNTSSSPPRGDRRGRPGPTPAEFRDAGRGRRIQKVLAEAGIGSRRTCEELITAGEVSVNGHVISDLPCWVDPATDRILVHGKALPAPEKPVYIVLYKPRKVVCTNDDPEGRPRAIDLISHPAKARLFPVGRLDMDSTGLLLLTNDGEMANRLTHPRHGIHKIYEVTVRGRLEEDDVRKLEVGLFLTRERPQPSRARSSSKPSAARTTRSRLRIVKRDRESTRLVMELREGRNRQIRRMMAQLGYPVKRLRRIQIGPIMMRGLKAGQWRELLPQEIKTLRAVTRSATRQRRGKPAK